MTSGRASRPLAPASLCFAAVLLLSVRAVSAAEEEGVEGLCAAAVRVAHPKLGSGPVALQLSAEGPAEDLADAFESRCAASLAALGVQPAPLFSAERLVRVRVRLGGASLVAVVETVARSVDAGSAVLSSDVVLVPVGNALAAWLSALQPGLSTWLAGSVEGEVVALCGADADGDGLAEVALVQPGSVEVVRWRSSGFEPLARVDLPPALRSRSRVPAAAAACRVEEGALVVAIGVPDRARGAVLRLSAGRLGPATPVEGVPAGFDAAGAPMLVESAAGVPLLRWKGRAYAALAGGAAGLFGVTQEGLMLREGEPFGVAPAGVGLALADLDGDGAPELVRTLPVFPGPGVVDRLVVHDPGAPAVARYESGPLPGVFGALGTVRVAGRRERVLGVRRVEGRSLLHALGHRARDEDAP